MSVVLNAVVVSASVLGTLIILFLLLLLFFHCRQDWLFYAPKRNDNANGDNKKRINTVTPSAVATEEASMNAQSSGSSLVTVKRESVESSDGVMLRGYRMTYTGPRLDVDKCRMILYMHGARVYLPNKLGFLKSMSQKLQADVLAIAYRGFSDSDRARPRE